jgi:hypothetical protein
MLCCIRIWGVPRHANRLSLVNNMHMERIRMD